MFTKAPRRRSRLSAHGWYALKDRLQSEPIEALHLLQTLDQTEGSEASFGKLIRFASRFWASRLPREALGIEGWLEVATKLSLKSQADVTQGIHDGLLGRTKLTAPKNWDTFSAALAKHPDAKVREMLLGLQTLFGDGVAAEKLAGLVQDDTLAADARINALGRWPRIEWKGRAILAFKYVRDRLLGTEAVTSILHVGTIEDAKKLITMLAEKNARQSSIDALVQSLVARREYLPCSLKPWKAGRIRVEAVGAASLRQMQMLNDPNIDERLNRLGRKLS